MLRRFNCVQLFTTLWTAACQTSLSMEFSRQEYWSRLPCLPPGDLPHPGIKPTFLTSLALAGRFFTPSTTMVSFFFHRRYRCCTCLLCSSAWTSGRRAFWPDILADGHKPLCPLSAPPPGLPSPIPAPPRESAFLFTQQTIEEMCQDTFTVGSSFHVWINLFFLTQEGWETCWQHGMIQICLVFKEVS